MTTDPGLLTEILINLLDNALRYSPANTFVLVKLCVVADCPRIEIEDQGPGIPLEGREQVFQRFHRLSRDQGKEGTGLGLSIVRTLAQELQIRVGLHDRAEGVGLRVVLDLPPAAKGS